MDILISQDFFPKVGGAHLWLYEVYRRWPRPVKLATVSYNLSSDDAQKQHDIDQVDHGQIEIFRNNPLIDKIDIFDLRCIRNLSQIIRNVRNIADRSAATLHCLRAFPEGFVGLLAKATRPPRSRLITYAHGEEILVAQTSRQLSMMTRLVYSASDLIIANSQNTAGMVKRVCPNAKVVCIHPGVDVQAFNRSRAELTEKRLTWGWHSDTVVISTIARMEPRKNHSMVMRALSELREEGLSIGYVCGTDGQEKEKLSNMATELSLQSWVRFTGTISDEDKILTYGASDIFAMPSIRHGEMIEGFGIVFLEAAAAGIPTISGNVGGQPEAVIHGITGYVVDGENVEEVKTAMRRLASDTCLRQKMGNEGRRWALQNDWEEVTKKTYAAVRGALS
jgi:phosphatidyl-myo-inositol dimannoside synthase